MPEQAGQMSMFEDELAREPFPTSFLSPDPSAPHLARVEIKAFKGIEQLSVDLPKIAVLTGPNNSGKSTVLQAIIAGFECFRLCLDATNWRFLEHGRAVRELGFLPINEPRDMWFERRTRLGRTAGVPITLSLSFTNGFACTFTIRQLFGFLNVRATEWSGDAGSETFRQIASTFPVLIPAVSGLNPHEAPHYAAQVHRLAGTGQPWAVLRNILLEIQDQAEERQRFVRRAIREYFGVDLAPIDFDPRRDIELRATYNERTYDLDIVSAGSGMNQILQLLSLVVWRGSRIVLVDEPDAHLHTSLQSSLYDFLSDLSDQLDLQILMATHSRDLISRAPIETIIPVDLAQSELSPIGSIDHLLLEYRRHGAVSNVDIALLYQSRRCLFVEGPSDARYLPLFARQLGLDCFVGREQVVIFEFRGGDKFTMIGDLVCLFERMIGETVSCMAIRDRHYAIPQVLEVHKKQAEDKGIPKYHIWERFSIENYLLDPAVLTQAVAAKAAHQGGEGLTQDVIETLLSEASQVVLIDAEAHYVTESGNAYMRYEIAEENVRDHAHKDAFTFLHENVSDLPGYLWFLPGDALFGKFVELLQQTSGINIRPEDVISAMELDSVPAEIREVLEEVAGL